MTLLFVLIAVRMDLLIGSNYFRDTVCIAFIANEAYLQGDVTGLIDSDRNQIDILKYNWYNIENQQEAWSYVNGREDDLFLIYDCEFVEIFAKKQYIIANLYENAQKRGFKEVEYITDVNDGRAIFDVL